MMNDPLSDFLRNGNNLQNGSRLPQDAIPVNYKIQPPPQNPGGSFLDSLNPMNWLRSMLQQNPEVQQVIDVIDQNGGDAKTAFYNECKKRNADPNSILQQVQNHPLFKKFMK